jgi:hypothetical protein
VKTGIRAIGNEVVFKGTKPDCSKQKFLLIGDVFAKAKLAEIDVFKAKNTL